jgi:hypothetical protein
VLLWAAINGGGSVGAPVRRGFREGEAAGRRVGLRGALSRAQRKVRRHGEARGCRGRRRSAAREEGAASWRLRTHLTGGPHVSVRGRERRGEVGRRVRLGREGRMGRGEEKGSGPDGERVWGFGLFFLFFQILFKQLFKTFL